MLEYEKGILDDTVNNKGCQKAAKVRAEYIREWKIELKILTKIFEQCFMVRDGKPIYLTEEQWDWSYDHLLDAHSDIMYFLNYYNNLSFYRHLEEKLDLKTEVEMDKLFSHSEDELLSSFQEYMDLFEKDFDSFSERGSYRKYRSTGLRCD